MLALWKKSYNKPRQCIKKSETLLANKSSYSQSYGFSSSQVWTWELNHKEGWALKNWCVWITVLEKTLESPLDNKEIKPVNPKGNQPRLFIGRTAAEAPILWSSDAKNQLFKKTLMPGKVEGKRRKRRQDTMVGWHHWLDGHEFEQTQGDSAGKGRLVCFSSWDRKEWDIT